MRVLIEVSASIRHDAPRMEPQHVADELDESTVFQHPCLRAAIKDHSFSGWMYVAWIASAVAVALSVKPPGAALVAVSLQPRAA